MTLQALDLCCVRGERRLFKGLSLSLEAGRRCACAAPTARQDHLAAHLAGLAHAEAGEVRWQGADCRLPR
jgi:heme exporter protein A